MSKKKTNQPYVAKAISSHSMEPTVTSMYRTAVTVPEVRYTPYVHKVIQHIVAHQPQEIGWLGLVDKTAYGYLVTDLYIPQQTVSAAETDIDQDAMAALALEIDEAGLDPSKLLYWGHSHVNMAVSPSHQDEQQIASFVENSPFFIRGIYNKYGDRKVDVYDKQSNTVFQCVKDTVDTPELTKQEVKDLNSLMKSNLQKPVYTYKAPLHHQSLSKFTRSPFLTGLAFDDDATYLDKITDPFYEGGY